MRCITCGIPVCVLLGAAPGLFAQNDAAAAPENNPTATARYQVMLTGLSMATFRDFATSPLYYTGPGTAASAGRLKRSDAREQLFQFRTDLNVTLSLAPESKIIQPGGFAMFVQFNLYYHRLWKLPLLSDEKSNFKAGGAILSTQNFRVNPLLGNNGLGIENVSNVLATAQLTTDISRTAPKRLNLLFFKPTLKPKKRELRFLLNVGVLNFNHRPAAHTYTDVGEIVGLETNLADLIISNRWSLNGWRLHTQLEYLSYRANGNYRGISYVWDAAHVPGRFEDFQMASHRLQFTHGLMRKNR
jgi:hypothetical protein